MDCLAKIPDCENFPNELSDRNPASLSKIFWWVSWYLLWLGLWLGPVCGWDFGVNKELVRFVVQILLSSEPKNFEKFKNEDNFLIFGVGPNFSMLKIILCYLPKILIRNKKFIFGYSILRRYKLSFLNPFSLAPFEILKMQTNVKLQS